MRKYDWSIEKIEEALVGSNSYNEVLRKLNIPTVGNNATTLKRILVQNNIIVDFNYKATYKNRAAARTKDIKEYLTENSTISSYKLGLKIFKEGLKEYKCECCGLSNWMGREIRLQIHHIDGNHTNNRLENIQVLCPNCHSQTNNFCTKAEKKIKYCPDCGREILGSSNYCFDCALKHR